MVRPSRVAALATPTETIEDTIVASMSMVASAARYSGKAPRIFVPPRPWQLEAYRHYGICGEARFAANWLGNALSRVTLHVVESLKDKTVVTEGKEAEDLDALFGGADGQSQMMQALGMHLTIAGEAYLVGRTVTALEDPEGGAAEVWEVLAVTEVKANGSTWAITDREQEGKADIELGEEDVVIRIWRPHPERRREADSPFRSLLPVLSEIEWATQHIFAQLTSRLASAGLLFVSDGIEIATAQQNDDESAVAAQNTASALMTALAAGMMRSLENSGSPERLVPLILTVPEELLKSGKIAELMHFWTELDTEAKTIRSDAITRFADGMDIPAEKLRGMSSSPSTGGGNSTGPNHWGMWQIDEEAITLHVEPLAEIIVNFVAIGYLRPLNPASTRAVWYDSAALRLRPDRSKESIELYNLGLVSSEVVLRENRFKPEDAMKPEEFKLWLLTKIAMGQSAATPEQVAAALGALGIEVPSGTPGPGQPASRGPKAVPSIEDHPTRGIPQRDAAGLMVASEALVLRALERAGNRLRQRGRNGVQPNPGVPAYAIHTVLSAGDYTGALEDAFNGTAEVVLDGIADASKVVPALNSYCESLVTDQKAHSREALAKVLTAEGLL